MEPARALSYEERISWLRLTRAEGVGPITFRRLLRKFGDASSALDALPTLAARSGRRNALKAPTRDFAERELAYAETLGAEFIAYGEARYPAMLAAIEDAPPLLCVRGSAELFERRAIAIVGSRNASALGRKFARDLAADLGAAGVVVVSGMARGVDGAAHDAALATGTIAVMAGGADVIYPPQHQDLYAAVVERGAVVSERRMGSAPVARDFPRRNRIISGLSFGVIVVEAAARSGTLITARFALEQGREVFAAPGSPLDPRCEGANRLIRDGATLIQNAGDVLRAMDEQSRGAHKLHEADGLFFENADLESELEDDVARDDLKERVKSLIGFTPVHRDAILRESSAPAAALADALLELTLSGEIEEYPGGQFGRAAND